MLHVQKDSLRGSRRPKFLPEKQNQREHENEQIRPWNN